MPSCGHRRTEGRRGRIALGPGFLSLPWPPLPLRSSRAQPRESNPPEPSPFLPQSQRWLKTSYRNLLHAAPPMGARSVRASEAGIALDERRFLPNGVRGTAETHGAGATFEVACWGPVETETYNHNHNHSIGMNTVS